MKKAEFRADRDSNAFDLEDLEKLWLLSNDLMTIVGLDGVFKRVNPAFKRVLGYDESEILTHFVTEFIHPEDVQATLDAQDNGIRYAQEGRTSAGRGFFVRFLRKDGAVRWIRWDGNPGKSKLYGDVFCCVGSDVTEQVETRRALEESEARFRAISLSTPVPMFVSRTSDGKMLFANEKFYEVFRVPPERRENLHDREFYDKPEVRESRVRKVLDEGGIFLQEALVRRLDGSTFWTLISAVPLEFGGESAILGNFADIEALRKTEESLKEAQRIAHIGSWEYDVIEGKSAISEETRRILGWPTELTNPQPADFLARVHPEDRDPVLAAFERSAETGETYELEYRVIRPDGGIRHIFDRTVAVKDGQGRLVRRKGVIFDITKQKEAQALLARRQTQMAYSSKMSALGQMAAGMAHEINNPLAIVHGKASQLRALAEQGRLDRERVLAAAEKIEATALRIAKIVKGLRSFARESERDAYERAGLRQIVDETLEFCGQRFQNHGIRLDVGEIQDHLALECRAAQISQVLLNLLNNAFDAVEPLPEKWVRLEAIDGGDSIQVVIVDSGPGIPADVQQRMMEPFFTTKVIGKGTGLGLSISKGIIEEHGGTMWIDSASSNTRFVILLPKVRAQLSV